METVGKYDIFFTFIEYDESNAGKERPVAIIEIFEDGDVILEYPIYSYRKRFLEESNMQRYFEILDLEKAGLNKRSFIDTHRVNAIPAEQIRRSRKLGHLSELDIIRLHDFLDQFGYTSE